MKWYVYQITDGVPNKYRYIVIEGENASDAIVNSELLDDETVDTISDLESILGGEVKVIKA